MAVIVLASGAGGAGADTSASTIIGWRPYEPNWEVLAVGTGERRIEIGVTERTCGSQNLMLVLHESRRAIRITVSAEAPEWSGTEPISCPPPDLQPRTVALRHRLAGREIEASQPAPLTRLTFGGPTSSEGNVVPRLIGLSPRDARACLSHLSLQGQIARSRAGRGRSRVVGQRPAPGTFLAVGGSVRLQLARS